jgi:hypothetical protein
MTARQAAPPERPGRLRWFRHAGEWLLSDSAIYALILITFAGSLGHGIEVAKKYGPAHGGAVEAIFIAASIDLFCYAMAKERQRDKRIGRKRHGIASMPTFALIVGVALTLAFNLKTATPNAWGYVVAGLPGGLLLIVIAILERRESFQPKIAGQHRVPGTASAQKRASAGTGNQSRKASTGYPVPGAGQPGTAAGDHAGSPAAASSEAGTGTAATFRSEGELEAEALRILAAHKAKTGERMGAKAFRAALGVQYGRSLMIRVEVKDREEALP